MLYRVRAQNCACRTHARNLTIISASGIERISTLPDTFSLYSLRNQRRTFCQATSAAKMISRSTCFRDRGRRSCTTLYLLSNLREGRFANGDFRGPFSFSECPGISSRANACRGCFSRVYTNTCFLVPSDAKPRV